MERAHLARDRIRELKNRISYCELQKRRLVTYRRKLINNYLYDIARKWLDQKARSEVYSQYKNKLNRKIKGKTADEWFTFYKNHIDRCRSKIRKERTKLIGKNILLSLIPIIFSLITIAVAFNYGPVILGFAIMGEQQEFVQNVNITFPESGDYEWQPEQVGILNSFRISGNFEGNGYVKVYLDDLLIFDSNNLPEIKKPAEEIPITGFASSSSYSEGNASQNKSLSPLQGELPSSETRSFENICEETCDIGNLDLNKTSYILRIEISNATLNLNEIKYSIIQIEIPSPKEEIPAPLPEEVVKIPEVPEEELPEIPVPKAIQESVIQSQAIIGQPVKWTKQVNLPEETANYKINLPVYAENIKITDISEDKEISYEDAPEQELAIPEIAAQEKKEKQIMLKIPVQEIQIEYETPAPVAIETSLEKGKKTLTVSSEFNYTNILAYSNIPEAETKDEIKLYHLSENGKETIDFNPVDTNGNGLIDRIEWIVPHLSNQSYEISLTIINVQSYPTVTGNWTVLFNTTGIADLKITATDGTTWTNYADENYDLKFLELKCGANAQSYEWLGSDCTQTGNCSVFIQNYTCDNKTGNEISLVITPGEHTLEFDFGGIKKYAKNYAVLNETILTISNTVTLCGEVKNYTKIVVTSSGVLNVCPRNGAGTGYVNITLGAYGNFTVESGGLVNGTGAGATGGAGSTDATTATVSYQGMRGDTWAAGSQSTSANGPGGGGGNRSSASYAAGGGGGGFGGAGGGGGYSSSSATRGQGGGTAGSNGNTMLLAGSGGGGGEGDSALAGAAAGAGLKVDAGSGYIKIAGTINVKGTQGGGANDVDTGSGGGGSGGHVILRAYVMNISNAVIDAGGGDGGNTGAGSAADDCGGGGGGGGRIVILYNTIQNTSTTYGVAGGAVTTAGCTNDPATGSTGTVYHAADNFGTSAVFSVNMTSPASDITPNVDDTFVMNCTPITGGLPNGVNMSYDYNSSTFKWKPIETAGSVNLTINTGNSNPEVGVYNNTLYTATVTVKSVGTYNVRCKLYNSTKAVNSTSQKVTASAGAPPDVYSVALNLPASNPNIYEGGAFAINCTAITGGASTGVSISYEYNSSAFAWKAIETSGSVNLTVNVNPRTNVANKTAYNATVTGRTAGTYNVRCRAYNSTTSVNSSTQQVTVLNWWEAYTYSLNVNISNNLATALTDFQVNVTLNTSGLIAAGKMNSSCNDIRFVNSTGSEIYYWIEDSTCNSTTTKLWVKVPRIPASGTEIITMYYGNPSAAAGKNGDATFLFFDDFNGASLNTTKWTTGLYVGEENCPWAYQAAVGYNTPAVTNGYLNFSGTRSATDNALEDGVASAWWGRSVKGNTNVPEENFTVEAYFWFDESSSGAYTGFYTEFALGVGTDKDNYIEGKQQYNNFIGIHREVSNTKGDATTVAHNAVKQTWKRVLFEFRNGASLNSNYTIDGASASYSVGQTLTSKNITIGFNHRAPSAIVNQWVDWLFARKYAPIEPTASIIEVQLTPAIYSVTLNQPTSDPNINVTQTFGMNCTAITGGATSGVSISYEYNSTTFAWKAIETSGYVNLTTTTNLEADITNNTMYNRTIIGRTTGNYTVRCRAYNSTTSVYSANQTVTVNALPFISSDEAVNVTSIFINDYFCVNATITNEQGNLNASSVVAQIWNTTSYVNVSMTNATGGPCGAGGDVFGAAIQATAAGVWNYSYVFASDLNKNNMAKDISPDLSVNVYYRPDVFSVILNQPASDPNIYVGNTFTITCTAITGNASTGVNISYEYNSSSFAWKAIEISGVVNLTVSINPREDVANNTAYDATVTGRTADTYNVRCRAYNSTTSVYSGNQTVTINPHAYILNITYPTTSNKAQVSDGTNLTIHFNFTRDGAALTSNVNVTGILIGGQTCTIQLGGIYSKSVTIQNNLGYALTDFQVNITVNTSALIAAGKMNSSCKDIRFANSTGSQLPYWIKTDTCNKTSTEIWVRVPNIPASGTENITMSYGNSSASAGSNGTATFIFFDDFEGPCNSIISSCFVKYSGNPVFANTSSNDLNYSYDARGMREVFIMQVINETTYEKSYQENGVYRMFYNSVGNVSGDEWFTSLATSTDKYNWTRTQAQITKNFTNKSWDSVTRQASIVYKYNGTYYLYHVSSNSTTADDAWSANCPVAPYRVGLATTTNISNASSWVTQNNGDPVWDIKPGTPYSNWVAASELLRDPSNSSQWLMFGSGADATYQRLMRFKSVDLVNWTYVGLLTGQYDTTGEENPKIVKADDGNYYMTSNHIEGDHTDSVYLYRNASANLSSWTYLGTVVSASGSGWDAVTIGMPGMLYENSILWIYYDGGPTTGHGGRQIGISKNGGVGTDKNWTAGPGGQAGSGGPGVWSVETKDGSSRMQLIDGLDPSMDTLYISIGMTANYTIEGNVIRDSEAHHYYSGFTFRFSNQQNFYATWMAYDNTENVLTIARMLSGTASDIGAAVAKAISPNVYYNLSLSVFTNSTGGTNFTFVVDGTTRTGADNQLATSTNVGLFGHAGDYGQISKTWYDDFRVRKWASIVPSTSVGTEQASSAGTVYDSTSNLWNVTCTVPSGLYGLQNLYVEGNATAYSNALANETETAAVQYPAAGTADVISVTLNQPTSDPNTNIGDTFLMNCTPITGGATSGVNISYEYNSTTFAWKAIEISGSVNLTASINPRADVANNTMYNTTVTGQTAGTYNVRCRAYNSTTSVYSANQTVTVNAAATYPVFSDHAVNVSLIGNNKYAKFNLSVTDVDGINFVNGTINSAERIFTQGTGNEWYYNFLCDSSGTKSWTYVSANDTLNYWNSTAVSGVSSICDANAPTSSAEAVNITSIYVNNYFCINATITDAEGNLNSSGVFAQIWNTTSYVNVTMSNATSGPCGAGGDVFGASIQATSIGAWNYSNIFAYDLAGNLLAKDISPDLSVDVQAVTYPVFSDYAVNETLIGNGKYAKFNLSVTDTDGINFVNGTIDSAERIFTQGTGNEWYYNYQCTSSGTKSWTWVGANDTLNYWNSTTVSGVSFICDANAPTSTDEGINATSLYTNEYFCINATITDAEGNLNASSVFAQIWNTTSYVNVTMSNATSGPCGAGGSTFGVSVQATAIGVWNYSDVFASDLAGNNLAKDISPDLSVTVSAAPDTAPPAIIWDSPTPNDGQTVSANSVYLNTTVIDESNTSAFFDWNFTLRGYWSFEAYNGTGVFDNSTYSNFAEFKNGTSTSDIKNAVYGKGVETNATEYLEVPDSSSLDISDALTIEFWVFDPPEGYEETDVKSSDDIPADYNNSRAAETAEGENFQDYEESSSNLITGYYHVMISYERSMFVKLSNIIGVLGDRIWDFLKHPILTGFAVIGKQQEFAQNVNITFLESDDYEWQPEQAGILDSFKISGNVEGNGYAKVYLDDLLVFDSNNLPEIKKPAEEIPITGFASSSSYSESTRENESLSPLPRVFSSETKSFENICEETCDIGNLGLNKTSYNLRIEISNATLNLNEIKYSITFIEIPTPEVPEEEIPAPLPEEIREPGEYVRQQAVINEPVKWTRSIGLPEKTANYKITLPDYAENIKITDISEDREVSYEEIPKQELTALEVSALKEKKEKQIILKIPIQKIEIIYETPAPVAVETPLVKGRKTITVSSDFNYTNVLAYSNVPEVSKDRIRLYHIVDGARQQTDFNPVDTNGNGLIDRIEWIVPHLSNQSYEISLTIINVQSYPAVTGNWTVEFTTTGTADLTIRAVEDTEWSNETENYDLKFLEVKCGGNKLPDYQWINNSVLIPNYSCDEKGAEISKVLTGGKHTLEFRFGDDVEYARNEAYLEISGETMLCGEVSNYTRIVVTSTGILHICPYNGTAGTGYVNITLGSNGNFTVDAGGLVNGTGAGGPGGAGTIATDGTAAYQGTRGDTWATGSQSTSANGGGGGGAARTDNKDSASGGGGGFGNSGGTGGEQGGATPGTGGGSYGAADSTVLLAGSGAGGGSSDEDGRVGGAGGAGFKVSAGAGRITIKGTINVNGTQGIGGAAQDEGAGGGGSGGHVVLSAAKINITGLISAAGSKGGDASTVGVDNCGGGGGGGGRIVVVYQYFFNNSMSYGVAGGAAGDSNACDTPPSAGTAGSYYIAYNQFATPAVYNVTLNAPESDPNLTEGQSFLMNCTAITAGNAYVNISFDYNSSAFAWKAIETSGEVNFTTTGQNPAVDAENGTMYSINVTGNYAGIYNVRCRAYNSTTSINSSSQQVTVTALDKSVYSATLNEPTSDPDINIDDNFLINCTAITGGATSGVNISFEYNSSTFDWKAIEISGSVNLTASINPRANVANNTMYNTTVTGHSADTYNIRCRAYNSTTSVYSANQTVTVNAAATYPVFSDHAVNVSLIGNNKYAKFNLSVTDVDGINFVNGTINSAEKIFTQGSGNEWYYNFLCDSSGTKSWTWVGANDTLNYWNSTTVSGVSFVCDANAPTSSDEGINVTSIYTNEYFCINATITDAGGNLNSSGVFAQIWNTTSYVNVTMSNATSGPCGAGGDVFGASIQATSIGAWNYSNIFAYDLAGNLLAKDISPDLSVDVQAVTYPIFSDHAVNVSLIGNNKYAKFNLSVTDTDGINFVNGTIDSAERIFTQGTGNEWYYNFLCDSSGTKSWTYVSANDTLNYWNSTSVSGVSFECDMTYPAISIISPKNTTYNIAIIDFNVSVSENASWCGFSLDGAANTTMTEFNKTYFNYTKTDFSAGSHDIIFSCNDSIGNMNSSGLLFFTTGITPLINGTNNAINSTIKFYDATTHGKKYDKTAKSHVFNVSYGTYDIGITPQNRYVKDIILYNATFDEDTLTFVQLDNPNDSVGDLNVYAVNPNMTFANATITINASFTELYKCTEWNSISRAPQSNCSWTKIDNLNVGSLYNITLLPGDPGYAELSQAIECYSAGSPAVCTVSEVNVSDDVYAYSALGYLDSYQNLLAQARTWHNSTDIPDGSTIDNVTVKMEWYVANASETCCVYIYKNSTQQWINLTAVGSAGCKGTEALYEYAALPYITTESDAENIQVKINYSSTAPNDAASDELYVDLMEVIVNYSEPVSPGTIVGKGTSAYEIRINESLDILGYVNSESVTAPVTKAWYHVAMTYNGSDLKLYVDGVLKDTTSFEGAINLNNNNLSIMKGVNGSIDELRIYSRALSEEEINASFSNKIYRLYHNFTDLDDATYNYTAYAIDSGGYLNITTTRRVTTSTGIGPAVYSVTLNAPTSDPNINEGSTFAINCTAITGGASTGVSISYEYNSSAFAWKAIETSGSVNLTVNVNPRINVANKTAYNATVTGHTAATYNVRCRAYNSTTSVYSGTQQVTVSSVNQAPQITNVSAIPNTNPLENSTRAVVFNFLMYDSNGVGNLDDTSVQANFSRVGEALRENTSCGLIGDVDSYTANYSCTIGMWYWDEAGLWNITVTGKDLGGLSATNDSTTFQYNLLRAIVISPNNIFFDIKTGAKNQTASNHPTIVNNTGNAIGNITINATNLYGESNNAIFIDVANFSVSNATGGTPPAECAGAVLSNAVNTTIVGASLFKGNLSQGNGVAQQQLYYCIREVPAISTQNYTTTKAGSWTISIIGIAVIPLNRKRKRKNVRDDKLIDALNLIAEELRQEYSLNKKELVNIIIEKLREKYKISRREITELIKTRQELEIPVTIFSKKLGGLEAVTKYMKENLGMRHHEIAEALQRDDRTIWTTYQNAKKKQPEPFTIKDAQISLPMSAFKDKELTILESTVLYLRMKGFTYSQIAKLIDRDQRNVWTIYSRTTNKLK